MTANPNHQSRSIGGKLSPYRPKAFTDDQVREIREKRAQGTSARDLAVEYGVTAGTIRHVVARSTYGWVR